MGKGCIGVALVLAVGCGPTLNVRGQLAERAREDMRCTDIHRVLQLSEDAFEVDGCGMMTEYGDSGTGELRVFHRITPAATIASAEMACDVRQLETLSDPRPTRRTFNGCGATATYDLFCTEGVGCQWQRDGEVQHPMIVPASSAPPITPVAPASTDVVPPPPGAT